MKLLGVTEDVLATGEIAWTAHFDNGTRLDLDEEGISLGRVLAPWWLIVEKLTDADNEAGMDA